MAKGKKGTGPYGSREKGQNLKGVLIRVHKNDYVIIKQMLVKDGAAFQHLTTACLEAYLRRDAEVLRILKDWKDANVIRKEDKNRFDFSDRERRAILDELDGELVDTEDAD